MIARVRSEDQRNPQRFAGTPTCSVNFGASGVAYALYRIACTKSDPDLLALADSWLASALAHQKGDVVSCQEALDHFVSLADAASSTCVDLVLGRSGLLMACTMLNNTVVPGMDVDRQALLRIGNRISGGLTKQLARPLDVATQSAQSGTWIAHGRAGLIYAVLCWTLSTDAPLPNELEAEFHELEQQLHGIRNSQMGSGAAHRPVLFSSWCNGFSGIVHLWRLAAKLTGEARYRQLAEEAAIITWENPSLELGSLCCGLAGQSYGMLGQFRSTGDPVWLERARIRGEQAAQSMNEGHFPEHLRNSLFKGETGVAVLASDLESAQQSYMPFFETMR